MDTSTKACAILQRLSDRLHDATIDYQCHKGVHEFLVRYAGCRFMLRFPEQALLRRGMQELEEATARIVERIRLNSKVDSAAELG
jgi:hypothetical protein